LVVSSSVDGLVAVHDTRKPLADDDAFVAATNVDTSVEELGLYGASHERMWVRTGTESLHLWEWGRAASETAAGGEAAFADFRDVRETAAAGARAAGGALAAAFAEGVQYIAGCHYDAATGQLVMLAGQEGCVGFWPVAEQPCAATGVMVGADLGAPAMLLSGAHTGVVRSLQYVGPLAQGVGFVTGGEDAQICLWTCDPSLPPQGAAGTAAVGVAAGGKGSHRHGGGKERQGPAAGGPGGVGAGDAAVNTQPGLRHVRKAARSAGGSKQQQTIRMSPY
jgi:hypothetical protein